MIKFGLKGLTEEELKKLRDQHLSDLEAFFVNPKINLDAIDKAKYRYVYLNKEWDFLLDSDGGTFVNNLFNWKNHRPPWFIKHDYYAQNFKYHNGSRTKNQYMLDIGLELQKDCYKAGYSYLHSVMIFLGAYLIGWKFAKR
jgi:hypothetical protein